jgi:uncharacterized delta-60 repeat protein
MAFGAPEVVAAAPGDLDVSFGQGGIVVTDFGGTDVAAAVAIQPDGKLVVAGRSNVGGNASFALARYNRNDGGLDPTFGNGGLVVTDFGATDQAFAVAVQPDGKVVTAGRRGSDSIVARYNQDGTPDVAFGTGGRVITNFGATEQALALALHPDGKILIVGRTNNGGNFNFALARYQSTGILDPGFGSSGLVTTDFGGSVDRAFALALQPDGKAVVVGDSDGDFAVARYNLDGSLDPAFGSGGKVITTFGGADQASAVVVQGDGKIVVAGQTDTGVSIDVALARYNPNGSLDAAFGSGGRVTTNFSASSDDVASTVALQFDGKIIVAGDTDENFALARYNPDGSLDGTFGNAGKVTTNLGSDDRIHAMALQPDGAIVVVGESNDQFALARYQAFPPLSLQLQPNQREFNTGDSLHLDLTVENLGLQRVVDVYFGSLPGPASHCPVGDAVVFFGPGFSPMPTCFSLGSLSFTPLASNVGIPSGLPSSVIPNFFSFVWPPDWSPGTQTLFLALTRPGTLDLIVVATTAVSLSP